MCGICFVLNIPIQNHSFQFDFFSFYNPCNTQKQLPLNKHLIQNKLLLSNSFIPKNVIKLIGNRGPDHIKITQLQIGKTLYKDTKIDANHQQEFKVQKGNAFIIQSTLHLRGDKIYHSNTQGSFFLYNGQIWDAGNLTPIQSEKGQNDSQWLHQILINCKGNQQLMLKVLRQIRGDYAIILIQNDKIYIMKDYFGKRSLLVGMSQDHLVITSAPIQKSNQNKKDEKQQVNNEDQQKQTSWKQKYEAQWLSSKNKRFFQMPNNSLITITLKNNKATWKHSTIYDFSLRNIQKNIKQTEQEIMQNCKKLLIQSVSQLTKCIKYINFSEQIKQIIAQDLIQKEKQLKNNAKIAVLFSGGIDSTLIARILDIVLPKQQEIDLINLAFRNDAPDRQSGKISYQQLKSISPERKYNLILLDKNLNDIEQIKSHLSQVIYPKTTHMDFNIASALHIASKQTKAKIILTGLGADEIFSGYSRYRIAFKRAGYEQMENQMLFDMDRLWIRNLGRDDRAIAFNGKEVRYPFLYVPLWKYLRTVELNKITEGTGQKLLLRKIAKEFKLLTASTFKKKAIQFGTRLAKLSNVKCFGSNRKAKGTYQYK